MASRYEPICDCRCLLEDSSERRNVDLEHIRAGLIVGIEQADAGSFAEGTAEEVINRAFSCARTPPAR